MVDLHALIDACCEAYDDPDFKPVTGLTYCNMAVSFVASKMGYDGFHGLLANQIIDLMRTRPEEWNPLPLDNAQFFANGGYLVIAGEKADPHGHVVIVRPGIQAYSPKWGIQVPKVLNIGQENFIGKHLGFSFKDVPKDIFFFKG